MIIDKMVILSGIRGKRLVLGPITYNAQIRNDGDGLGPYLTAWSVLELGPVPTLADGFTANELRYEIKTELPQTPPQTVDEIRDEALLADTDRKSVYDAIRNATPAQIKSYINTQVTDLASAKTMLIKIALLVALGTRR